MSPDEASETMKGACIIMYRQLSVLSSVCATHRSYPPPATPRDTGYVYHYHNVHVCIMEIKLKSCVLESQRCSLLLAHNWGLVFNLCTLYNHIETPLILTYCMFFFYIYFNIRKC